MTTLAQPRHTSVETGGDDLYHLVCCDADLTCCGLDATDIPWGPPDSGPPCVVCHDLEDTFCGAPGCPFGGAP